MSMYQIRDKATGEIGTKLMGISELIKRYSRVDFASLDAANVELIRVTVGKRQVVDLEQEVTRLLIREQRRKEK